MKITLKNDKKIRVLSSLDIYTVMREILLLEEPNDRSKEHFWTISIDHGHTILNIELVALGSVNQVPVEPMEVYSIPLQKKAVKLILVHNHPSGMLTPSSGDKDITDRLIQVGLIMQVPVMDHLIISEESYYSFSDNGLLHELSKSIKYVPAFILKDRFEKAGEAKGELKGMKEQQKQIVLRMREQGLTNDEIVELTGIKKGIVNRIK